jgi:arylsulfatase A-like enzyme
MLGTWRQAAILGALVGLIEASAIVRYDWIMDDPRAWRVGAGLLWAVLILAMNSLAFVGLARLCRGRAWVLALGWLLPICSIRAWTGDRFQWWSLVPAAIAILLSFRLERWPRVLGLFAVGLALPGLWGRVPVYGSTVIEWVQVLVPGVVLAIAAGAWLASATETVPSRPHLGRIGAAVLVGILGVGGAMAGMAPRGLPEQPVASDRPNVLFVLVDTLRADHVGPYGERATPSTRRLAEEGMRFEDAITVIPKTTQSVSAFYTGRYPVNNGVRVLADHLADDEQTLAEQFQAEGYRTAGFVHNGWVMRGRGLEQGFDQFWSFFEIERAWGPLRLTSLVTVLDWLTVRNIRSFDGNTDASVMTDLALDWMDRNANRGDPFFAYLHYFDPHWPYRPPDADGEIMVNNIRELKWSRGQMYFQNPLPAEENEKAVDLYGQEVDYNLDQVGRLLDFLDARGLTDNTIVVFTADHGHHLGDHDYWFHHGEFLYEPGLRIPMLVRYPGVIEAGSVESAQFRNVDLSPTLLELAGLDVPDNQDGLALSRIREEGSPPAYLETDISYFKMNKKRKIKGTLGNVRGVRDGRWKLHYTPRKKKGLWELYDLEKDPEESRNLIKKGQADPDVLWPMVELLATHISPEERAKLESMGNRFDVLPDGTDPPEEDDDSEGAGGTEDLDANDRSMLEALGYIDE